jgi:GNAT superfamily N-acetyltransferase
MITLIRTNDFTSVILRRRAEVHHLDADLVVLRADENGAEGALVAFNFVSGDDDEAILVEIFVPKDRQQQGLGSRVLSAAEQFARAAGRTRITIHAEPLDDDDCDDGNAKVRLITWYEKRGYRHGDGPYDEMEKEL